MITATDLVIAATSGAEARAEADIALMMALMLATRRALPPGMADTPTGA
jgi:hypothetical protein